MEPSYTKTPTDTETGKPMQKLWAHETVLTPGNVGLAFLHAVVWIYAIVLGFILSDAKFLATHPLNGTLSEVDAPYNKPMLLLTPIVQCVLLLVIVLHAASNVNGKNWHDQLGTVVLFHLLMLQLLLVGAGFTITYDVKDRSVVAYMYLIASTAGTAMVMVFYTASKTTEP